MSKRKCKSKKVQCTEPDCDKWFDPVFMTTLPGVLRERNANDPKMKETHDREEAQRIIKEDEKRRKVRLCPDCVKAAQKRMVEALKRKMARQKKRKA